MSLLPRLVEPQQLQPAHARIDGADAVSMTAGPALGGLVVTAVGAPLAVLVDSLTYVYSALTLRRLDLDEPPPRTGATAKGLLREVVDGVRWVYRGSGLSTLAFSTHAWFVGHAIIGVVLAPYVLRVLDLTAFQFGIFGAAGGVGAVLGATVTTWVGRRLGTGRTIAVCHVVTTLGAPFAAGVRYGGAGARLAKYLPLGGPAILALRGVADLEFGNVPVYDLYTGGVFLTDEMIGGSSSVRGVPDGRYSGLIKVFANAELRAMLVRVQLLGQQFAFGGNLLFDTGRLWSDYTFRSRLDGNGIGLKWGAGGGAYLQWGQAAVFRLEVAYSPDAKSENPSLPLGIYVEDGVMF